MKTVHRNCSKQKALTKVPPRPAHPILLDPVFRWSACTPRRSLNLCPHQWCNLSLLVVPRPLCTDLRGLSSPPHASLAAWTTQRTHHGGHPPGHRVRDTGVHHGVQAIHSLIRALPHPRGLREWFGQAPWNPQGSQQRAETGPARLEGFEGRLFQGCIWIGGRFCWVLGE